MAATGEAMWSAMLRSLETEVRWWREVLSSLLLSLLFEDAEGRTLVGGWGESECGGLREKRALWCDCDCDCGMF